MRKYPIWLLLMVMLVVESCDKRPDGPPNIIFIMSDDHAAKAISAYDTSLIRTPHIDRLADRGIRFDNCYCTNAICAPSRAVILTGKYSHQNGVVDNFRSFDGEQQTLPKLLQEAGYKTAIIGKWHLKSDPTGFDHWLILPGQGHYYRPGFRGPDTTYIFDGYVTDIITEKGIDFLDSLDKDQPFFLMLHHKAPHENWQPAIRHLDRFKDVKFPVPANLHDDHKGKSKAPREQEMTISKHISLDYDLKMEDTLIRKKGLEQEFFYYHEDAALKDRIKEVLDDDDYRIWFNYYAERVKEYNSLPDDPSILDEWKYQQYMEDYLSCISTIDDNVGVLLDYLESSGLSENTIVVYTSDQGFFLGEHGWYDKRFMYQEAHQMPMIISMPDGMHSTNSHMINNADFAPTLLELAGLEVPSDMQGESFAGALQGDGLEQWREAVYYHYFEYPAVHSVKRHYGILTEKYKLIHFYYDIDEWEFYDIQNDPHEMNNLYGKTDYSDIVQDLKVKLYALQEHYGDTDLERFLPTFPDTLTHLALNRPYKLEIKPNEKYNTKDNSLTDGIAYPEGEAFQLTDTDWCGFWGDDFVMEMDLGNVVKVSSISAGFLLDQRRWIFLPLEVDFFTSADGENYKNIRVELSEDLAKNHTLMKVNASANYKNEEIRYIRIVAKNNILPDWHSGAGNPAWIFTDEIIVR
jgi:arylsulfatase A-like enzyme